VLVFEDIHWAEPAQLDLLEYLSAQVRDRPVLFLALARSELLEVRPAWGSGVLGHTTIPLEPLSARIRRRSRRTSCRRPAIRPRSSGWSRWPRQPALHRGAGGVAGRPGSLRRTADHGASRDRLADRRAAARVAAYAPRRVGDRQALLARGPARDRRCRRDRRGARRARGQGPDPAGVGEPGAGRCGVLLQAHPDPRGGLRDAPAGRSAATARGGAAFIEDSVQDRGRNLAWILPTIGARPERTGRPFPT
jgi:hypothetical protein